MTLVLDANVLIAHLDARDALHARATQLLAAGAGEPFAASVLTLAEVLVGAARAARLPAAEAALGDLGVRALPIAEGAAGRLAHLRASTGLRLPDCAVLLAAQDAGAAAIATFHERLAREAERLGLAA